MSHNLERLLARLKTPRLIQEIKGEFSRSAIEHALSHDLITDQDLNLSYKLTEKGRAAIAA